MIAAARCAFVAKLIAQSALHPFRVLKLLMT